MVIMTHQTLSLEKYWKLLPATLIANSIRPIFLGPKFNNTSRNNWKPLFELNFSRNSTKTIRLFALDFYLNNRVFLSRNYRLVVAPRKFDVLKTKILSEKRSFEGKYASFKNIKFPRGNYQTDSSET